jgi:hypothetical protein
VYRAQPYNVKSWTEAEIIDRVLDIGAGLTRSDVFSVVEGLKQVIPRIIKEGGTINTGLLNATFSVRGVFTAATDVNTPTVRLNLHPGALLREAIKDMSTRRVDNVETGGRIASVFDVKTGTLNQSITRGRNIRINGVKIKIAGPAPAPGILDPNGIWFINPSNGRRFKADPTDVSINNPTELMVVVPESLPSGFGPFNIEVVTQFSNSTTHLKHPRTITFTKPLEAVAA